MSKNKQISRERNKWTGRQADGKMDWQTDGWDNDTTNQQINQL